MDTPTHRSDNDPVRYCIAVGIIWKGQGRPFIICIGTEAECEEVRALYGLTHERTKPRVYTGRFPNFCRLIETEELVQLINGESNG